MYIETRYPDRWSDGRNNRDRYDRPARVDYTLTVPRSVNLDEIKLINGNLDLKDVSGEVHTTTVNGQIRAENLEGEVRISTVNGDMELSILHLSRTNPVEISSVNGRVRLTIPSDANARISANTVHGRISNDFDLPVNKGRFVGRKLSGRIGDGDGRVDLGNVNGAITIRQANDGRTKSPVENLLRETKSRSRRDNDDDWTGTGIMTATTMMTRGTMMTRAGQMVHTAGIGIMTTTCLRRCTQSNPWSWKL